MIAYGCFATYICLGYS